MSEHLHAVVLDDAVTNVVVLTPEVAVEFVELGVYGKAELVDLDGADPVPGIGWTRDGDGWAPPVLSEEPVEVPPAEPDADS